MRKGIYRDILERRIIIGNIIESISWVTAALFLTISSYSNTEFERRCNIAENRKQEMREHARSALEKQMLSVYEIPYTF